MVANLTVDDSETSQKEKVQVGGKVEAAIEFEMFRVSYVLVILPTLDSVLLT